MNINKLKIRQATALTGLVPVETKKMRTYRGSISTGSEELRAFVKLLPFEQLAKEAICAVLARKLSLSCPEPFYVQADPSITGYKSGNLIHLAFGLEEELGASRMSDEIVDQVLPSWTHLTRCAAFDAWIGNKDRVSNNLLFAGNGDFWLIDHDEALPDWITPTSSESTELMKVVLKHTKSEKEFHQLREELLGFSNDYLGIDWGEIREYLLYDDQEKELKILFDRYIDNLEQRAKNMKTIIDKEIDFKQLDLGLGGIKVIQEGDTTWH